MAGQFLRAEPPEKLLSKSPEKLPPKPCCADETPPKENCSNRCWQWLRETLCCKKPSKVQAATAVPEHKKQEKISSGQQEKSDGISGSGDKPGVLGGFGRDNRLEPVSSSEQHRLLPNNQDNRYTSSPEKSSGTPGIGEKKTATSLPEASGSPGQYAKRKLADSVITDQLSQIRQDISNGIPIGKSDANLGVGDKKMESKLPETSSSKVQDAKEKPGIPKQVYQLKNGQEKSYQSPTRKSNGSPGAGDKQVDLKRPETIGRTNEDAKAETGSSLIPHQISQTNHESSYRIPAEKSSVSRGVGDKKVDSKRPETVGRTHEDAKAETGGSLIPGQTSQTKQESSYRIPAEKSSVSHGVGDKEVDSKQPEASGISVQDAKTKPVSSLVPGHLSPNKQEISYATPAEKSKGSPGVGEKKMDSKLPDASGNSYQDAKSKIATNLKPELQNKQENSNGRPGVGEKKVDSKLSEDLRISDQNAKAKTANTIKPGNLLQNKQGAGSPEQLAHKSPPKADVRPEDISKDGKFKDPKSQNLTTSGLKHSSEEQQRADLLARNEKQKDIVKYPSFKNKDTMTTKSTVAPTSSEQQKGFSKQEDKNEDQIRKKPSSPMLTNFSSDAQGAQFLSRDQQKSAVKQEAIQKNDKNTGPSYPASSGYPSKEQQKGVHKHDSSYEILRDTRPDPTKTTINGSGQKGIRKQEDLNTKDKFSF